MDFFKPTPQNVTVRLESSPIGADARTSLGPSCKTPCSVSVPVTDNFTVSYSLDKFQPQTVAVRTSQASGDVLTDPNPVFAELQPVAPPKKMTRPVRKRKPKPAAAAPADAAPAADSGTAFPAPAAPPAR